MKSLTLRRDRELIWSQPNAFKREFELHDDSELVAALKWHRQLGSLATAETADGQWTLKRSGFLRPRVTIRTLGGGDQIAQYEAGWAGGGQLLFPDGRGYIWRQRSFWHNEWAFENERGIVITQFRASMSILKEKIQLTLVGVENHVPDCPLLAVLGLYLMILSNDDATASTLLITA